MHKSVATMCTDCLASSARKQRIFLGRVGKLSRLWAISQFGRRLDLHAPVTLHSAAGSPFAQAAAVDSRNESWRAVLRRRRGFPRAARPSASSLGSGPARTPPDQALVVPASASSSVLISAISGSIQTGSLFV
jgi:hypothetical protein